MPYLSLIVPTMRVGGLDFLFDSLARQSFTDFELILVDSIKKHRETVVREEARDRFIRVVHVEPSPNQFPVASFCASANAGLIHASGEVAMFCVDYTRLPPDAIGKHAEFHRTHGPNDGLMAPHRYIGLDADPYFPRYGRDEIGRYVDDLKASRLDPFMFSIGKPTNRPAPAFEVDQGTIANADADPKLRMPAGPVDAVYFHSKNESVRFEKALEINGWDEELDGSHGYQDSDFAERLSKAGVRWTLDPSFVAEIVNPREVFPFAKRTRPFRDNEMRWQAKKERGYPAVNTSCSLIGRRGLSGKNSGIKIEDGYKGGSIESAFRRDSKTLRLAMIYGEFSSAIHGPFDIEGLYSRQGLTGSESSFFNLAFTLAERGHEIVVFCVVDEPTEWRGVQVMPIASLRGLPQVQGLDAVIAWNEPDYLRFSPKGVRRICDQQLNDWGYCREKIKDNVDVFVFPSASSRANHMAQGIHGGEVIPNSVDLDLFTVRGPSLASDGDKVYRQPHRVVYCSSPDRGLHHLLGWWPDIRARIPDAELKIFYRLDPWIARARDNNDEVGRRARYIEAALSRLSRFGVSVVGLVPNTVMAHELQQAAVLAYPCDPVRYTEGFGCSVLDATAAGCVPIISGADALAEVHGSAAHVLPNLDRKTWVDAICGWLEWRETNTGTAPEMKAHAENHSRQKVADAWEVLLGA